MWESRLEQPPPGRKNPLFHHTNIGSVVSGASETVSSPAWLRTTCSWASMAQRTASNLFDLSRLHG